LLGRAKRASLPKFEVSSMYDQGKREAQTMVDDGKGRLEVWRIEDFEMAPVDESMYGQFFGGDSYVILYTYLKNGKENYIIYFWQVMSAHTHVPHNKYSQQLGQ